MNTAFGGNRVGGRVSLDIAGSYPTGLMAPLGTLYNDPQQFINAQLRYTATQLDINSQQAAEYAQQNIRIEETATLAPTSLDMQLAATVYKNASNQVNYINQNTSDLANTAYVNALSVYKLCKDASHIAYLNYEAVKLHQKAIENEIIVRSVGKSKPNISEVDITSLSTMSTLVGNYNNDAHDAVTHTYDNITSYHFTLVGILSDAILKSGVISVNLSTIACFNSVVKAVLKNITDPLNDISGKETLITQYVPSIPLNNAIQVATLAKTAIEGFISALSLKNTTNSTITTSISSTGELVEDLDSLARANDLTMYLTSATAKQLIETVSSIRGRGSIISIPNEYPFNPEWVAMSEVQIANDSKKIALAIDTTASNARLVYNALLNLQVKFASNTDSNQSVIDCANNSLQILNTMMSNVNKITSNSSAYSAVAITRRASNTINGILSKIEIEEAVSISAASEAESVLTLINDANQKSLIQTEPSEAQKILWSVNTAMKKAEDISEKLKYKSYILSKTAINLVTPTTIAIQTATAVNLGASNNNSLSRLERNSRNAPAYPPLPYKHVQADIRAKTFVPIRPSLDELVYKNRLSSVPVNSLKTVTGTKIRVAQEVQNITTNSVFSYKQK